MVLMENVGILPPKLFYTDDYGIFIFCTEGIAQLEYDGVEVRLEKNDLFLYMVKSVATKFLCSPDFTTFRLTSCSQRFTSTLWIMSCSRLISSCCQKG